ncbi:MAG: DNA-3-methyladenine glycosylase 2 family protein [Rhodospirillales bacterium]|nr:DNA-3-methyladenine glycosylase 2 family protein [Rhodospirillales bacterium]
MVTHVVIDTPEALQKGLRSLLRRDPRLRPVNRTAGKWTERGIAAGDSGLLRRQPGFASLLRIIVEQQVSVASANAIWGRLEDQVNLVPEDLLRADDTTLRGVGLSGQKIRYGRELATEIIEGRLVLDTLQHMSEEDATAELVRVKGIGRWTAEIYLMFVLGRPDVWPAGDVALQNAVRDLLELDVRPNVKEMDVLSEPWRPWRSVAARLFWHSYEAVRTAS